MNRPFSKPGIFLQVTYPFQKLVYFYRQPTHFQNLVYFHGRPAHFRKWFIFTSDLLVQKTSLFLWVTYPFQKLVYFCEWPTHFKNLSTFTGNLPILQFQTRFFIKSLQNFTKTKKKTKWNTLSRLILKTNVWFWVSILYG